MDSAIDPTAGTAIQEQNTTSDAREANAEGVKDVSLEEEVKQLVGSVSTWWTGFSKRSQDQITAARKEIESQGGIVSIARKEAQRFEAQLNEAQKAARERSQVVEAPQEQSDKGKGKASSDKEGADKGKEREVLEGDDGAAVEALEVKTRRKSRSDSRSEPMVMGTGEAIFDVDGNVGDETVSVDETIQVARQNAQTALNNVQSFWDRLQADPRLNNIQASLAKTLENVSMPKSRDVKEGAEGEEGAAKPLSFTDVSKQFQASFPHLNWKESQALAKKYYEASENVARDWGKEMNTLMSDLVKIVPPEGQGKTGAEASAAVAEKKPDIVAATKKDAGMPSASTEEEDFDWDGDMDSQSASTGLQTTTGPATASWEGSASGSESGLLPKVAATPTTTTAVKAEKAEEEEDAESDWE